MIFFANLNHGPKEMLRYYIVFVDRENLL